MQSMEPWHKPLRPLPASPHTPCVFAETSTIRAYSLSRRAAREPRMGDRLVSLV